MTSLATKAGASAAGVLLLTSIHHVYGAYIYASLWRAHVAHVSALGIVVIAGALLILRRWPNTRAGDIALWSFVIVTALFPVAWIGLFEGGYNHVVKDALYMAGAPHAVMRTLFPAPLYEMPDDVLFEVSGVLQLPLALVALHYTYCLVRARIARAPARTHT